MHNHGQHWDLAQQLLLYAETEEIWLGWCLWCQSYIGNFFRVNIADVKRKKKICLREQNQAILVWTHVTIVFDDEMYKCYSTEIKPQGKGDRRRRCSYSSSLSTQIIYTSLSQ